MKKYDYTKLKALRDERKLTQKDMGNILGITQGAYNKLETGNRKRKTDSIFDIEKLAEAFELTPPRLITILTGQENVRDSGIKEADLWLVHKATKNEPLREDEFILFTSDVFELDKHDFKKSYSGINLKDYDSDLCRIDNGQPLPMWEYPPVLNIITAIGVEIGSDKENDSLIGISLWLGNKKLGVIKEEFVELVDGLIKASLISRVVIIENVDGIAGYFDTYMKAVFIASNAVCKSCSFDKGRFKSLRLLNEEEIRKLDNNEEEE